jgi:putative membrane protein
MHWNDGWTSWWWMPVGMLLAWIVIAIVVVLIVRTFVRPSSGSDAFEALDDRYARGEIEEDEYRRRRATLRELQRR